MNRLIIIGNGFDLAHGLPTSYKDFIDDYFVEAINICFKENKFQDELISIVFYQNVRLSNLPSLNSLDEVNTFLKSNTRHFKLTYNSYFFQGLLKKMINLKWVDIENEYFEALKKCKLYDGSNFIDDYSKVSKLNFEFTLIKIKLEKYLIKVVNKYTKAINPFKYSKVFSDLILKEEVLLKQIESNFYPNNIQILNFNYTSIVEVSANAIKDIPYEINYIHGELGEEKNPIIFGFGDEYDEDYKGFEDKKNNILFEHIKSFGYFKAQNYHNLIRFLESDDYQVYIIGHSCGLSDRTMLKEIFENEKCKSIKIFYYDKGKGENDYVEKTMEISRHFDDKGLMRKKIVPFPLSKSM